MHPPSFEDEEIEGETSDDAGDRVPVNDENEPDWLGLWSCPDDPAKRRLVDSTAASPDHTGQVLCWRRSQQCKNPDCVDDHLKQDQSRRHRTTIGMIFHFDTNGLFSCSVSTTP